MIVLGIDPGTARMGCSVVKFTENTRPVLIESNVFITVPEDEMPFRLKKLYDSLLAMIKKHTPDVVVVEKLFFNTNAKTAIHVGQARGIVMLAAASKKMPVFEYTALEAKKVLTGYGRADKKEMQLAIQKYFKLENIVKSDDANDAVAMALCFIQKRGEAKS